MEGRGSKFEEGCPASLAPTSGLELSYYAPRAIRRALREVLIRESLLTYASQQLERERLGLQGYLAHQRKRTPHPPRVRGGWALSCRRGTPVDRVDERSDRSHSLKRSDTRGRLQEGGHPPLPTARRASRETPASRCFPWPRSRVACPYRGISLIRNRTQLGPVYGPKGGGRFLLGEVPLYTNTSFQKRRLPMTKIKNFDSEPLWG